MAWVGFCWGGRTSFTFATHDPGLGAAVVYYGTSPESEALAAVEAPVLGLYGEDDARAVNETIPPAQNRMEELGKSFRVEIFDGAGHGFLRAQDGREGRNLTASSQAWPLTVRFFRNISVPDLPNERTKEGFHVGTATAGVRRWRSALPRPGPLLPRRPRPGVSC